MKIGSKIALFYTLITTGCIAVVVGLLYLLLSRYINTLFDTYLYEKAVLTAQKHWEKDEVDALSYDTIRRRYYGLLPEAEEILLDTKDTVRLHDSLNRYLSKRQQAALFGRGSTAFTAGSRRGYALYYPDNEGTFVVLVLAENSYGMDIRHHMLLQGGGVLLVSCLLIGLLGLLYAKRVLYPFKRLLGKLEQIRGNSLNTRLTPPGNQDEIDELVGVLNEMLNRIDRAFRSEKSFINNASHELNNPMTAIQIECEISLLRERTPEEYAASLRRIQDESQRITFLIKQLLFLSREDKDLLLDTERVGMRALLEKLCHRYPNVACMAEEGEAWVNGNASLLGIAFENLIGNAVKYSNGKGVEVRMGHAPTEVRITVTDYGIGIPEGDLQSVFQPFYRADNVRAYGGQGIGLSLSKRIINLYQGEISVASQVGVYTTFTVVFPIVSLDEEGA